jgi:TetR/AcrR family transcriptional regulator of autoinduction and epiphytic fitness
MKPDAQVAVETGSVRAKPGTPRPGGSPKRQAVLEAAIAEFEACGFGGTSMDRIALRANVSKRTVYNHFSSKDALFGAIIAELSDKMAEVTGLGYDSGAPLEAQLSVIGLQVIDMLTSPCTVALARVALAEMLRSPEVAGRAYELVRARQSGLIDWLRAADADGKLAVPDPTCAADQFMGLLKSFAFWPHMVGGQSVPDAAARRCIVENSVAMMLARYRR